ncbi:MAG: hypothetical protein PVH82_14885 [Desulfobacteraceae bacterium]|jgi:hypothetical protein
MKNPFLDFHPNSYREQEDPVERIAQAKQDIMGWIVEAYLGLVRGEIKNLAWPVEHNRVLKVYGDAVSHLRGLQYDRYDIEAFCAELDSSDDLPYMIPGPAGLYISALVNHSYENRIRLRLQDYQRTFHFLGYALPKRKTLILQGDAGDFCGAGLQGGRLVVEGAVANWCGAGMLEGEIRVSKDAGRSTGEWMHGGEIRVGGTIQSVGQLRHGGRVLQDGKLIG